MREDIQKYEKELIEKLGKLVAINSEEGEPNEEAPFGKGPREALDVALSMMEEDGCVPIVTDVSFCLIDTLHIFAPPIICFHLPFN